MLDYNISLSSKCFVIGPSGSGTPFEYFSAKEKPMFTSDDFVIGFCGRFIQRKGVSELLSSVCNLRSLGYPITLLLIGASDQTQPMPSQFWETISSSNFVHVLPFTSSFNSLSSFYNSLDLFVLPAYWEGFGNVLVEAAYHGLPIITTQTTGCIDAVNSPHNALLVQPKDVDNLQDAILRLFFDDKLIFMSTNSFIWSTRFARSQIALNWLEFYDSV